MTIRYIINYNNLRIRLDNPINNELIIFDHVSGHKFRITFAFEDCKGKTKLTWNMKFESAEEFEKVKEKIDYVLFVIEVAERIPYKFFQHLERYRRTL